MTLDALREAGAIDGLDHALGRLVVRRAPEAPASVAVAAALASRAPTHGHAAVDLSTAAALLADEQEGEPRLPLPALPDVAAWRDALRAAPTVVRGPADPPGPPLVLDGTLLYLDRPYRQECAVAQRIRARAAVVRDDVDEAALRAGLAREFPDPSNLQRRAADTALRRGFTVIAGGPGTGKTATVVKIVALLRDQARARGVREPRVVMVAPTGKAAARLTEAVRGSGIQASTIHRALGLGPHLDADAAPEPLAADLVVVDEASMVDLSLMARLLGAVPAAARVVLLGDPDQLASVEHGSVLADVCAAGGLVGDCIVRLERSWRFDPAGGIARLARAIHAGDADAALAVLAGSPDVRRVDGDGDEPLRTLAVDAHRRVAAAPTPQDALSALAAFRVFCAHRQGPFGVERTGPRVEQWLASAGIVAPDDAFYALQPVMVLENDDRVWLYNGDTGIVLPGDGTLRAFFPGATAGTVRDLAPARLPRCETAYASTVHKSQGSEYGHVVALLPDAPSRLVTRELLYTAVTRASRDVTLVASEEVLRAGIALVTRRVTGLRARLAAR